MNKLNRLWPLLFVALVGAGLGYLAGLTWESYLKNNTPLLWALCGAAIALVCVSVYRAMSSGEREINVERIGVKVPFVGAELQVRISDARRVMGWKLFVESATRVSTQSLAADEGIIREALASQYKLFDIVRTELKGINPTRASGATATVESYALRMLNDGLRQMLSRWHPRLTKWEKTGSSESDWPLAELCRHDLESTRQILLAYTWGLGELLAVPDLENLLPSKPQGAKPALVPLADIHQKEQLCESALSESQKLAAWHVFVELNSRIATQPLARQGGSMREALTSLHQIFELARTELKKIGPISLGESGEASAPSVQSIIFDILNRQLRPFLAKWHPRLASWETENKDKPEDQWPENSLCRADLEERRRSIAAEAAKLRELIVQNLD